jgi:hypothetical protein
MISRSIDIIGTTARKFATIHNGPAYISSESDSETIRIEDSERIIILMCPADIQAKNPGLARFMRERGWDLSTIDVITIRSFGSYVGTSWKGCLCRYH